MRNRRVTEHLSAFFGSVAQKLSAVTDYFEWLVHLLWEGVVRLAGAIASLFYPRRVVERIRRNRAQRAMHRTESATQSRFGKFIERLEYIIQRCLEGIATVGRRCHRLLVPAQLIASTEQKVADRATDIFWRIRAVLKKLGERIAPKWVTRRAGRLYDAFVAVLLFVGAWLQSRDFRKLVRAIPAMLLAAPLAASIAYSLIYSQADKIHHYRTALAAAIESRDTAAEELCFQKLAQLGFQQTARAEYFSAFAIAENPDKRDEARERMKRIAPLEEPGFAPAHVWLAATLADDKTYGEERWELVKTHAEHAIAASTPRDGWLRDHARALLIDVAVNQQRIDDALRLMQVLSATVPMMHLELMTYYLAENDLAAAKRHARNVDLQMTGVDQARRSRADDRASRAVRPEDYLTWAQAKRLLGSEAAAIQALERGIKRFPAAEALRVEATERLVSQLSTVSQEDPREMQLIRRILQIDPRNPIAVERAAAKIEREDDQADRVLAELRESQLLSPTLLGRLGDAKVAQQDYKRAMELYTEASRLDPQDGRMWNNIAWIHGNVEPSDFESALRAVSKALAIRPEPRFYETRGQVLIKMQRWEEAIEDLRRALNGNLPNSTPAHESLEIAYRAIGNHELAEAHRNIAEANR